jgi:hypothetical protein
MQIISTLKYGQSLTAIHKITKDHVLHVYDIFDQEYFTKILQKGTPYAVVSDHMTTPPYSDPVPFYGLPLFSLRDANLITRGIQFDNTISTLNCFNFMINKKQINRYLCIKLVEYFKLVNFDYTWSAVDQKFDMHDILVELDSLGEHSPLDVDTKSFILAPIRLEKKFINFNKSIATSISIDNYGGNSWTWKNGLNKLFLNSAISLITESLQYQKAAAFTEKTLYSVLGLTFPIWVGGYNQATEWKRLGFDIFEDIIDHSYQSYDTLIERCYYAIFNNLHLLSNLQKTAELRESNSDRLLKNRDLILQNQLGKFVDQEICRLPAELQTVIPNIMNYFRRETQ